MGDFVKGSLKKNEIGAMDHDGLVYDRWLTLLLSDGQELEIFDSGAFAGDVPTDKLYETILWVYDPPYITYSLTPPSNVKSYERMGTIVDPRWKAPKVNYLCVSNTLHKGHWVVVATSFGWMLLDDTQFKVSILPGGFVQWKDTRLHLLAIF